MVGNKCNYVQNLGYPPTNRRSKTTFFWTTLQFNGTLTAYIFGMKQVYISGQVLWQLQGVSYIVSNRHELWSTNGFKLEVSFHLPSVNSAFHFIVHCQASQTDDGDQQTELNQLYQTVGGKSR